MRFTIFFLDIKCYFSSMFSLSLQRYINDGNFMDAGRLLLAITCLGCALKVFADVGEQRRSMWVLSEKFTVSGLTVSFAEVPIKPGGTPANRPTVVSGTVRNEGASNGYLLRIRLTVGFPDQEPRSIVYGFPARSSLAAGASSPFVIPLNAPLGISSVVVEVEERTLQAK